MLSSHDVFLNYTAGCKVADSAPEILSEDVVQDADSGDSEMLGLQGSTVFQMGEGVGWVL